MEALFLSIDQNAGPRIVANEVLKSRVQFDNINYHLTVVYFEATMDRTRQIKEGVDKLIPTRKVKSKRGRKITIHTRELGEPRGRKVIGEDQNSNRKEPR